MSYFESIFHEEVIFNEDKVDITDHYNRRMSNERETHRHDNDTLKRKNARDAAAKKYNEKNIPQDIQNQNRKDFNKNGPSKFNSMDRQMKEREDRKKQGEKIKQIMKPKESAFMDFDLD